MAERFEEIKAEDPSEVSERRSTRRDSRGFLPGKKIIGRFVIERMLGEGGMGQVFAAIDARRQTRVALKTLGELSPHAIRLIKREFRTAAELVHPNLVRLHELFSDGAEWFFTMDLVDGVTLPALIESTAAPRRAEVIRHVLRQLAVALNDLHKEGILHGDLKPSNFFVVGLDQRVVLLDFGLARPLGATQEREFAGTPAYMAPEQVMGHDLTAAADWYSFGVVLHEALTGELPHRIPSAALLEEAPADLRALCLSLLALSAGDRPQGEDVIVRFGEVSGARRMSAPSPVSRPVLLGRQRELATLDEALERTKSGKPEIVLLHGPSGIGKTALVERFVEAARRRGAHVLTGRCRERESMGYKAADGLIDEIVSLLDGLDTDEAAALLPDGIGELTILFPALRVAEALAKRPPEDFATRDRGVVRQRAISAFRTLLGELRRRAPLVVWLDDLQWSDEESALLLGRVLGGTEPVPLLFIGSFRGEPERATPLIDALLRDSDLALPKPTSIPVGPLGPEDSMRLALELLPRSDRDVTALAQSIGREAAGHPLFIAELAHSTTIGDEASRAHSTSNLPDLVRQRVTALDPVARRFLELSAVAGAPRSRAALRRAVGLSPSEAEAAIDVLKANRLAKSGGLREQDSVDTHHDRIREIVALDLSEERKKDCHLSLARVFELEQADKPEVVAAHYEAAGELPQAAHYWFAGADLALKALAFEHAADLYGKGIELGNLDAARRRALTIRRAEALAYAGKGTQAADLYLQTVPTCLPDEALELRRLAAEQLLLSGHIDRGLEVIEQVLSALGMQKTRTGRQAVLALVMNRMLVRARGLRHVRRSEHEVPKEELARVDASFTIANSLSVIDFMRGADFQTRHLSLALRAGEPKRLLRALTLEVSYAATPGVGSEKRTARLLRVAERLVASPEDHTAISLLSLTRGIAAYLQGDIDASLKHCERALFTLKTHCTGAVWETITSQRFAIASLFFLGRLHRLSEFVPPLLAEAESTGNLYATMCFRAAYSTAAWLARGDVAAARRQLARVSEQWVARGYQLSHYNLLVGESFVDFYEGNAESAHARIVEQWPNLVSAGFLHVGVLRVQLWHLRAAGACMAAEVAATQGRSSRARELRLEARAFVRRLRRDPMRRAAALADLVDAEIDRVEGERARAQARLDDCARSFREQGLSLFSAAALVRRGQLGGGALSDQEVSEARDEFVREGVAEPDRMILVMAPGPIG